MGAMSGETWKDELRKHFEAFKIIEKAQADTLESFTQFCEFIAEPAFESLKEEMKDHGVRVRFRKEKGLAIDIELSFPGSNTDNFHYRIVLPRNAYELKLGLVLKGRRSKSAPLEEKAAEFMKELPPAEIMKISKEALIRDILECYGDFALSSLTSPD
jgi:hypothetical protein